MDHTRTQFLINVQQLQQGWRFCCVHGSICIPPGEPKWKDICSDCYIDKAGPPKYCKLCGNKLDKNQINYGQKVGRPAKTCLMCKRWGKKPIQPYNVLVPDHWEPHLLLPPTDVQTPEAPEGGTSDKKEKSK